MGNSSNDRNADIEHLVDIYKTIDEFAMIMGNANELLDKTINVYEDLESLMIDKCMLQSNLESQDYNTIEYANIVNEIKEYEYQISEKEQIICVFLDNAHALFDCLN